MDHELINIGVDIILMASQSAFEERVLAAQEEQEAMWSPTNFEIDPNTMRYVERPIPVGRSFRSAPVFAPGTRRMTRVTEI